jgi:metal-responsive CopG/Arc/MetJ family transcriptional regulator
MKIKIKKKVAGRRPQMGVVVDPDTLEKLDHLADQAGVSRSEAVRQILEEVLR